MNLDQVAVVVMYTKKLHEDGTPYHAAEYVPEHVYYGTGAASDAQRAREAANELNGMYLTPTRSYGAVRVDLEEAINEELL